MTKRGKRNFLFIYSNIKKKNTHPIYRIRKLFISNLIENQNQINNLSRESLLKIINAIPFYTKKNILELIDEEIKGYNNDTIIELSNMRINDIKSELYKTKYKTLRDFLDFEIYEYENYHDVYFTGKEINVEKIMKDVKTKINYENFEIIHISSRTIKIPHVLKIKKDESSDEDEIIKKETINDKIIQKLKKIKRIETIKIRFYFKTEYSPVIIKKEKKKK